MKPTLDSRRIARKFYLWRKEIKQMLGPKSEEQQILFVLGCQRSGTTLMLQIFENDPQAKVFGEYSSLSRKGAQRLRLHPLPEVQQTLQRVRVPLVVLKPLVEAQRAPELLAFFANSKALWMYRNFRDVASSNLALFGMDNGINDLRPIVEQDSSDWRAEHVPEEVRRLIFKHFAPDMNPYDAAVLFWCARNSLFFDLQLDRHPAVLLCQYEALVSAPGELVASIYREIGRSYPGPHIHPGIYSRSVNRGRDITLSPDVADLAEHIQAKLDAEFSHRRRHNSLSIRDIVPAGG